jgi:hypothetical protein
MGLIDALGNQMSAVITGYDPADIDRVKGYSLLLLIVVYVIGFSRYVRWRM